MGLGELGTNTQRVSLLPGTGRPEVKPSKRTRPDSSGMSTTRAKTPRFTSGVTTTCFQVSAEHAVEEPQDLPTHQAGDEDTEKIDEHQPDRDPRKRVAQGKNPLGESVDIDHDEDGDAEGNGGQDARQELRTEVCSHAIHEDPLGLSILRGQGPPRVIKNWV